jgi:hypothetical protein
MSMGFFAGIIPAVIMIFATLKEYDKYYEDKHFLGLLAVGLVSGTFISLIYYWCIIYLSENLNILVLIFIIIGMAIFEVLLLRIILSMKWLGGKYEITYFGVVIGGSFAGVLAMFCIFVYMVTHDITLQAVVSIIFLVPALSLVYIPTGALVGYGVYKKSSIKQPIKIILVKSIFNSIFIFWLIAFLFWSEGGWELMVFGVLFGVFMYTYVYRGVLPAALPVKLQKHRRRAKRRAREKRS